MLNHGQYAFGLHKNVECFELKVFWGILKQGIREVSADDSNNYNTEYILYRVTFMQINSVSY